MNYLLASLVWVFTCGPTITQTYRHVNAFLLSVSNSILHFPLCHISHYLHLLPQHRIQRSIARHSWVCVEWITGGEWVGMVGGAWKNEWCVLYLQSFPWPTRSAFIRKQTTKLNITETDCKTYVPVWAPTWPQSNETENSEIRCRFPAHDESLRNPKESWSPILWSDLPVSTDPVWSARYNW